MKDRVQIKQTNKMCTQSLVFSFVLVSTVYLPVMLDKLHKPATTTNIWKTMFFLKNFLKCQNTLLYW